ncbi:hypothetical protein A2526_03850 [candidate division WOR-1 bacterium RIFOXYD2_FULL_36_8]|uniref:Uncharacterized protein n=1 Tax=candidate division WOR-1 bacterium RIFOXYB2_FULL_36_35 TaxID=1802578 RepID=A0A1F4S608_UNCSA|nr:MAG: hypothetical protein A2230_02065 [candidate division WOR-1 bacterium RIFOXYA2_FULL_36_21]OGC15862.1 MAG: hypothetical protein A2290_05960 [candidate division WOR-1 bacterium RIFOXYB2_FULL_36_35]OGC21186.1 MAG: hypothetical protein A2282_05930 [candidate division WOR-1 bacterium RIFOXYA12_FULL_36_13]OGC38812.1 MAG: hypothetical protein A2526_03850 [candidate division WOR-1 bacterium RIFOXYD2_FULL_36_8]
MIVEENNSKKLKAKQKPILFISYSTVELALACFIENIIRGHVGDKIDIFVASRMPPGDKWQHTMLENKLKNADAIIPICSIASKLSGWVWWESAVVWANDKKIYPLTINISMNEFGAPLSLFAQAKSYFEIEELEETIKTIFSYFKLDTDFILSVEEKKELNDLKGEYFKKDTSAHIEIKYKTKEITQLLHEYSLEFSLTNNTKEAFKEVLCELYFPLIFIKDKSWRMPHITASKWKEDDRYLCLTFDFNNLRESAKNQYRKFLLPGKTLMPFGGAIHREAITPLLYSVDSFTHRNIDDYNVFWKVYINEGAPQDGIVPFKKLQEF